MSQSKYQKSYRKHRAERLAKAKAYYEKNRSKRLKYKEGYRETNKRQLSEKFIAYYHSHKPVLLAKSKEYYRKLKEENRKKYLEYKTLHSCFCCGESNPVVLEFHHKVKQNGNSGDMNVSKLISNKSSWDRILKEIEKCVVLCSNCHIVVHDRQKTCQENGTPFSLDSFIQTKKDGVGD